MKMRARWKFWGRKPTATPLAMMATSGPMLLGSSTSSSVSLTEYAKKASPAMATMPAASPSRPSIRLMALTMATSHSTVTTKAKSWDKMTASSTGRRRLSTVTPANARALPASTMEATLAGADISRTSS